MPFDTVVPTGIRRELAAKVDEIVPPRKKNYLKKNGSKYVFD